MRIQLLSFLIAAGTAISATASAQENVTIMTWGDYFDPAVFKAFEAETGIHVQEYPFDSSETMMTKLLVGNSGSDVVVASESLIPKFVKAGLLQKLDKGKMKELGNIDPDIAKLLKQVDPENEYVVPYTWGTTGIGYNIDAVQKRLGDVKVDSWSLLFDPDIVSKLKDCGVYMLDSPQTVYPVALAYLGKNPNSKSAEDIAAVEEMLAKVRPAIGNFKSTGYPSDLAGGEACVVMGWSGDIARADAEVAKAGNGIKLDYVVPKEGSTIWVDTFVVPKDAPNPDAARKLIDFLTRAEVAAQNSNYLRYPNGNKASFALLDEAIRKDTRLYPPADTYTRLFMVEMFTDDSLRNLTRSWTRVKAQQ